MLTPRWFGLAVLLLAVFGLAGQAEADDVLCNGHVANVVGTAGNDDDTTLAGGPGDDVIAGLGGNDQIVGGGGDDIICGGPGRDVVYFYGTPAAPSGYTEVINLEANTAVGTAGEDEIYEVEDAFGTDYADQLIGDAGDNGLTGGKGSDYIDGAGGSDRIMGDGEADKDAVDPSGDDELHGGPGPDFVVGEAGADSLFGEAGPDTLAGELGSDLVNGGSELDFASYACNYGSDLCVTPPTTGIQADMEAMTVTGSHGTDDLSAIEALIGTDAADTLLGSPTAADYFVPRMGDDTLDGGGSPIVNGQPVGDYVEYICRTLDGHHCGGDGNGVHVDLAAGQVTGAQGTDSLTGGFRNVVGSEAGDVIDGDGNANELFGQQGNDVIDGGAGDDGVEGEEGDDELSGGTGEDWLRYTLVKECGPDNRGVDVSLTGGVASGVGTDTIGTDFEQIIGSPCDDTLIGSSANDILFGSGGDDDLYGRSGNDLLVPHLASRGAAPPQVLPLVNGKDRLFGGAGDDTVSYSGSSSGVSADLSTGATSADGDGNQDTMLSVEALIGSDFGDELNGSAASNLLVGGDGSDSLSGRGGNDYLDGEDGDDSVDGGAGRYDFVDFLLGTAPVRAQISKSGGSATTTSGRDTLTRVEGIGGSDFADSIVGGDGRDFLFGEGGDDGTIKGGAEQDLLSGGAGQQAVNGGSGKDWCESGKLLACELKGPSKLTPTMRDARDFLADTRVFRSTGEEQLEHIREAVDAMRVHRIPDHD